MNRIYATCLIFLAFTTVATPAAAQPLKELHIGTGGIAGTYYPVGRTIAALINRAAGACEGSSDCVPADLIAVPQLSSGTVANLEDLERGRIQLALVQADQIPDGRDVPYRLVSALYTEAIHIVVREGSGIRTPGDLAGLAVSIDEEGSGTRVNALAVLADYGVRESDFKASYFKPEFAATQLEEDALDAFFIVAGTPTPSVTEVAARLDIRLLDIAEAHADSIVKRYPFMSRVRIPQGTYNGVPEVNTVGVEAYLVARRDVDPRVIHAIMRAIWSPEGRRELVSIHPPIADQALPAAVRGKALTIHDGAARYLAERGIEID